MLSIFELTSVLLLLCALFGFLNRALLQLPKSVGLLFLGMLASLILVAVELGAGLGHDLSPLLPGMPIATLAILCIASYLAGAAT
jgi:hypothetical protein